MKVKVFVLLMLTSFGSAAVDCTNLGIQPSTDESSGFIPDNNGTVTDKTTGLMWMRCAIGQTWQPSASSCQGTPLKGQWTQMALINNFNAIGFAGLNDWRLPNINELRSIVEDCRNDPAINTGLFPQTPAGKFWTSSPYVGLTSSAWIVDFSQGRDNFELKTNLNYVRLVRVAN